MTFIHMTLDRRHLLALFGSACGGTLTSSAFAPLRICTTARHEPTDRLRVFRSPASTAAICGSPSMAGKPILIVNNRVAMRLHPAICWPAAIVDALSRQGTLDHRRAVERFGGQEPGGPAEIDKTAHGEYGVNFPLAAKAEVRGPQAQPLL